MEGCLLDFQKKQILSKIDHKKPTKQLGKKRKEDFFSKELSF